MTYEIYEESLQSGEPIELYQFNFGSNIYRYTSARDDITHDGHIWASAFLKRNSIDFGVEKGRANLKIDTVRHFIIADLYRITPPSDVVLLTLYRKHRNDHEAVVMWTGRILAVDFEASNAKITCEPVTTSLKRTGLRRLYQRQCPHVLYGQSCGVNRASFAVSVTLSAVSGTTLNSAVFGLYANNYFAGGYFDFVQNGVTERRFITEHTGTQIKISLPLMGLNMNDVITAYPGCDHTMQTCKNTFANLNNYGGFPYIPSKNPFGGNGIY